MERGRPIKYEGCDADCGVVKELEFKFAELQTELERATKQSTENPWCMDCKEEHCLVDSDGTCAYIRDYHALKAGMREIYEVYANSEGIVETTAPEAYMAWLVKEMRDIASKFLKKVNE